MLEFYGFNAKKLEKSKPCLDYTLKAKRYNIAITMSKIERLITQHDTTRLTQEASNLIKKFLQA